MKNDTNSTVRNYQSCDQILEDLCKIAKSDLSDPAKFKLYDHLCWMFTEFYGKHCGVIYWSEKAYKVYCNKKKGENWCKKLRHEHVVPKSIFINSMFKNHDVADDDLKKHFSEKMIACIVTVEEDNLLNKKGLRTSMPDGNTNFFEISDIWERYKACGIEVLELEWKSKRSPQKVEKII